MTPVLALALLSILSIANICWASPLRQGPADTCGYQSCSLGSPDFLNVHLIPHTHDDVGWLKTVDEYYYGARSDIQHAGVQYILDTSIQALLADPKRRFIYVEMAFFYRWWNQQSEQLRQQVKTQLVDQGRLQFILGGWSMNDEASTHYTAIIDQHTRGFRFLRENFGECGRPLASWQIDPFGHSREQANLFALMGFDSLFFARLDNQEKWLRLQQRTAELIWRGGSDDYAAATSSDLFTSILYRDYCPPPGFCFDTFCADPPMMDDPRLFESNVQQRVDEFLQYIHEQSRNYTSNHLLVTMGCDFQFENAHTNFKNLDKLIYYVNQRQATGSKVNLMYSTPSCYTYAVNKAGLKYPTKTDDFFPYADKDHSFWTGYFTSRAALKGYTRMKNAELQITTRAGVLASVTDGRTPQSNMTQFWEDVDELRRAMGILQHHDAVSGTEKQGVAFDYAKRLAVASDKSGNSLSAAMNTFIEREAVKEGERATRAALNFRTCDLLNISRCSVVEQHLRDQQPFYLALYNGLGWNNSAYVRIPYSCKAAEHRVWLRGNNDDEYEDDDDIETQLIPVTPRTNSIPERGLDPSGVLADCELVFYARNISALGHQLYAIIVPADRTPRKVPAFTQKRSKTSGLVSLENAHYSLQVNTTPADGVLSCLLTNKHSSIKTTLAISLAHYIGFRGNNWESKNQSSGAYVFRPTSDAQPGGIKFPSLRVTGPVVGPHVQELYLDFNSSWATLVIRLYSNERSLELEWTVGPIPDDGGQGREVIVNYETQLNTLEAFYTDANGRQMLLRRKNVRPSNAFFQQSEQIAGNYYPINSRILLANVEGSAALAVLTDRSEGGASLRDGQVEVMLHRRTLNDDSYGVGEPLRELGCDGRGLVVRGRHWLVFETPDEIAAVHRILAMRVFAPPLALFATPAGEEGEAWLRAYSSGELRTVGGSRLRQPLPPNVHLLSLDTWSDNRILLRLEHIFQLTEDRVLSLPVTLSLADMFADFRITSAVEMALGVNIEREKLTRLVWSSSDETPADVSQFGTGVESEDPLTVTLAPMDIKTFLVRISPRQD